MDRVVIIGTSSTAKNVYNFIQKYNLFEVVGFAVNNHYKECDTFCNRPVYAIEDIDGVIDKSSDYLFVAIQWNNLNADRRRVFESLSEQGYKFANLISPTAIVNGTINGENCWICDQVIVDFGTIIDDNVFVKTGAYVADNVFVDSHCFIGAKSLIAGGVRIGKQTFVGLSATVFDDVHIGDKCLIGAVSVVKRHVEDYTVVKVKTTDMCVKQYDPDLIESKLQYKKNIR